MSDDDLELNEGEPIRSGEEFENRIAEKFLGRQASEETAPIEAAEPEAVDPDEAEGTEPTLEDRIVSKFDKGTPKAEAKAEPKASHSDDGFLTVQDSQAINQYETESQKFNQDLATYNQYLAHASQVTDPKQREELQFWLQETRQKLDERSKALDAVEKDIYDSVQERVKGRDQQRAAQGLEKVLKALPDFDDGKLITDLRQRGFTDEQIKREASPEVIIAFEESRRYREMRKNQKPRTAKRSTRPRASTQSMEDRIADKFLPKITRVSR